MRKGTDDLYIQAAMPGCYAYYHELLWYGIDAVAHVHLMHRSLDIHGGKITLDDFISRFCLDFESGNWGFSVPLEKIEHDGVFVPADAYISEKSRESQRKVHLFNSDYLNRVYHECWRDKDYAYRLIDRRWRPSDLQDPILAREGIRFGKDMWDTCIDGFERSKGGLLICIDPEGKENYGPEQPKEFTERGIKLIETYSKLISSYLPH